MNLDLQTTLPYQLSPPEAPVLQKQIDSNIPAAIGLAQSDVITHLFSSVRPSGINKKIVPNGATPNIQPTPFGAFA